MPGEPEAPPGTCRFCLEAKAGVIDGVCEECEAERVWCCVCRDWEARDEPCRHVFLTGRGVYHGAGSEEDPEALRESFWALLDLFVQVPRVGQDGWDWRGGPDPDIPAAMERRLRAGGLRTFTCGFMLSMPDLDLLAPEGGASSRTFATVHGNHPGRWQEEQHDLYCAASDGFGWLVSLEEARTPEANLLTADWIARWRLARGL